MRSDKLLANMGFGSRKEVKKLLKKGVFKVNDAVIKDGKTQVDPENDVMNIHGETLEYKPFIYLMMNKPPGYVSATEDKLETTIIDILKPKEASFQPFPVGRLDKDTTGLLLLTNDGKLAHQLTSPKKKVGKVYLVHLDEPVSQADIEELEQGVTLEDGYQTRPAKIDVVEEGNLSTLYITIYEGKYHQVKRMFQTRGRKVIALKRVKMGSLKLDPILDEGNYRELTFEELTLLTNGND